MISLRNSLFFPLTLSLVLGGLSFWLNQISEVQYEETALPANEPQYLMSNLKGVRFDENGQIKEQLTAQSAWQLPKQNQVFFRQPQFYAVQQQHTIYQVQAHEAQVNLDNKEITFTQNVVFTQTLNHPSETRTMQTEHLVIDTQKEMAHTHQTVHFQQGSSQVNANGMIYDYKQGKLNLPNKVKALIYAPHS